ncbi:ATP-binding protein [Candidatus Palauibacter sp.]|uniref:ATP-binding protein n=1 Tax=Candidatus Palauibacter sp. TaxID=3101350 RepID=UPI003AF2B637
MIVRDLAPTLMRAAAKMPVVTLTGPRQSGKTTLGRALFPRHAYRTLEAADVRAFAMEDPRTFLGQLPDGAIIDEIQRVPELLSYLQGIVDDDPAPGRWILTGSQNFLLLESVSQSLAGRTALHELLPLTWGEIRRFGRHPAALDEALFSGGYPRIFDQALDPTTWLRSYTGTYLERDVRTIVNVGNLTTFQRFVELCAGRTGQLLNYSALANDCGISQPTAREWFSILEASFIAFRLPAFHGTVRKRLVKAPKLYFYDTGLACWLLGIHELRQLRSHPLRGAIFETWVVSETLKNRANRGGGRRGLTFYRDRNGVEVDLVVEHLMGRTLVEAKSAGTPSSDMFRAARRVRDQLPDPPATDLTVVYGGDDHQQRGDGQLLPWRMVRAAALRDADAVVRVFSGGRPVGDARVLALFPNGTYKSANADEEGAAAFDLHSLNLPMTVFVAAPGFEARLEREWIPAERVLALELTPLPGGGGAIFPKATGIVPGLAGRLDPKRDSLARTYLYADNVAINGDQQQPVHFEPGEELHLEDADGTQRWVRILDIVGRSALIEYRSEPLR